MPTNVEHNFLVGWWPPL